jgi:hypothetical protein
MRSEGRSGSGHSEGEKAIPGEGRVKKREKRALGRSTVLGFLKPDAPKK